jgi:anti-anti-sigma factor
MSAADFPSIRPFSISVERDGDEIAVIPVGELDLATADVLDHEVRKARRAGFDHVVIDLRGVSFVDSTGLRILLSLSRDAAREGYGLSLVRGCHEIERIFELTATTPLFSWRER